MPLRPALALEPRKVPVQARSTASVEAILEATLQVLGTVGKERLTTTRVAARAGVSVGTLYQYFPNKSALLQAVLTRHLAKVTRAIEDVCKAQHGNTLQQTATSLVNAFLNAKMIDGKTSVALYSVSSDVDGARISHQMSLRSHKAIAAMLSSAAEPLASDPQIVASILLGTMTGVSRRLLESHAPEKHLEATRRQLITLTGAYLRASMNTN